MNCQACGEATKRFGKDRKGNQRYRCLTCRKVSVDQPERLFGDMILAEDKAIDVLHHLVRGCSIRATADLTEVNPETILKLLSLAGERCEKLMESRIQGLSVSEVQAD